MGKGLVCKHENKSGCTEPICKTEWGMLGDGDGHTYSLLAPSPAKSVTWVSESLPKIRCKTVKEETKRRPVISTCPTPASIHVYSRAFDHAYMHTWHIHIQTNVAGYLTTVSTPRLCYFHKINRRSRGRASHQLTESNHRW